MFLTALIRNIIAINFAISAVILFHVAKFFATVPMSIKTDLKEYNK